MAPFSQSPWEGNPVQFPHRGFSQSPAQQRFPGPMGHNSYQWPVGPPSDRSQKPILGWLRGSASCQAVPSNAYLALSALRMIYATLNKLAARKDHFEGERGSPLYRLA